MSYGNDDSHNDDDDDYDEMNTDLLYKQGVLENFACFHDADDGSLNVQLTIFINSSVCLLYFLSAAAAAAAAEVQSQTITASYS